MSEENVETIRKCYEAWNRRDFDAIVKAVGPEFNWAETTALGYVPGAPRVKDAEDAKRYMREGAEAWEVLSIEPEEFMESGDWVIASIRFRGRGKASGVEVENSLVHVFEFAKGKVARIESFRSKARALEAAGLSEA